MTSRSCALSADALDDVSLPIAPAEAALLKRIPKTISPVKISELYFIGPERFDEALARLDKAESLQGEPNAQANSSVAYTWFFLAMTHYRLGNVDEVRNWYDKAAAWTREVLARESEDGKPKPPVEWNRRLTLELLQKEASELLAKTAEPTAAVSKNAEVDADQ